MNLLLTLNKDFFEERSNFYSSNISSFNDFIKQKGITEENLVPYLRGIRTDEIVEALKYYINEKNITSIETANRYKSALKEYLYFVLHTEAVSNLELLKELESPTFKEASYNFKMNKVISNHPLLKDKEGFDVFSSEDVLELLAQCNDLLSSCDQFKRAFKTRKYFNRFRSALIIKLILLTGVAYRTLLNIKRTDLDTSHGIIIINEYEIRLPKALQKNFEMYLQLVNELNIERTELFVEFDGRAMNDQTGALFTFLNSFIRRGDLNGLIKYSIIKMIEVGISETIIKKVTGIEETILKDCHARAYDERTANRHFDSKIRSMEMYDEL